MASKGARISQTKSRLVPEAPQSNIHAIEDDDMIKWLGRDCFVNTIINGPPGWQAKVRHYVCGSLGVELYLQNVMGHGVCSLSFFVHS